MNFTSNYNYSRAFDSGNTNEAQVNELEIKKKIDSTSLKNEDFSNNNFNNDNSSNQKNTLPNKLDCLGIIEPIEKSNSDYSLKSKSKSELRKINSEIRKKNEKQKLLKSLSRGKLSIKYKIFLITLWIVFLASFIVGFITHFEIKLPITASGIIWSFSFVILIVALIYSMVYYKVAKSVDAEEKFRLLKYYPF